MNLAEVHIWLSCCAFIQGWSVANLNTILNELCRFFIVYFHAFALIS